MGEPLYCYTLNCNRTIIVMYKNPYQFHLVIIKYMGYYTISYYTKESSLSKFEYKLSWVVLNLKNNWLQRKKGIVK